MAGTYDVSFRSGKFILDARMFEDFVLRLFGNVDEECHKIYSVRDDDIEKLALWGCMQSAPEFS